MNLAELNDIKTQFYAIMEDYPTMYANFKVSPDLPSVRDKHDKTDAALTSLHRRMFTFKAALEKELDQNEDTMVNLSAKGAQLNARTARRTAILDNKTTMLPPSNSGANASASASPNIVVLEPFVSGLGNQLQGCNFNASGVATNCPCVEAGQNKCSTKCKNCPASANQLSLVAAAHDIEKKAYIYAIFRIIYLIIGICTVSYFVYQTVEGPDSTILEDAKAKADQLKTEMTNKTSNLIRDNNILTSTAANINTNPTK